MGAALLAGAALKVGSSIANTVAQNKVNAARSAALNRNAAMQAGYDKQIAGAQEDALRPYQTFASDNAQAQGTLAGMYNTGNIGNATGPNAPTATQPQSSSTLVQNEDAKQGAKKLAFANQQGGALAAVNAPASTLKLADLNRARDASSVGLLDSFKTGQAAVLPLQLDAANQSAGGLKSFADLLGGAGSLGISYGLNSAAMTPAAAAPAAVLPSFSMARLGGIGRM